MVVMKRAKSGGEAAALVARDCLASNNPATKSLLKMLPGDGQFPTMQQVEQEASAQLLTSLTKLAKECAAASFQPLEVFTRSRQCTTRKSAVKVLDIVETGQERRLRTKQPVVTLSKEFCQKAARDLQKLGVQKSMADLIVTYLRAFTLRRNAGNLTATLAEVELKHMLPGRLQCL